MSNNIATSSKRWDLSIEMLKAIAALLVMNSHMDAMYGEYSYLGTGGAIGDALFFFCSGYGLFLSKRTDNFFNWYKRRIQRIIPSVIAMFMIWWGCVRFGVPVKMGVSWFIQCILIYYVIIYPIKRYTSMYLWWALLAIAILSLGWYFLIGIDPVSRGNIYGPNFLKWCFYFDFMLFGAICGRWHMIVKQASTSENPSMPIKLSESSILIPLIGLCLSIVAFYGIYMYTRRLPEYEPFQLFSLIPLMGICWFLWRFANTDVSKKLMNNKYIGTILRFIGGLCLEILICQQLIFTTKLNHIFPWNIPLIMIAVILFAYIVRTLGRLILQTFQKEDYDWRAMIAPF